MNELSMNSSRWCTLARQAVNRQALSSPTRPMILHHTIPPVRGDSCDDVIDGEVPDLTIYWLVVCKDGSIILAV